MYGVHNVELSAKSWVTCQWDIEGTTRMFEVNGVNTVT